MSMVMMRALVALLLGVTLVVHAATPEARYGQQYQSVKGLQQALENTAPKDPTLTEVKRMVATAQKQARRGDYEQALAALANAYTSLSERLKQIKEPQSPVVTETGTSTPHLSLESLQRAYRQKAAAVRSLLEAYEAIEQEKSEQASQQPPSAFLRRRMGAAERLAKAKDWPEAVKEMEEVYGLLQQGIGAMRGGETLVRSLDFATPKEEYEYEQRRFQTHVLLVKFVLKQQGIERPEERVARSLAVANRLRRQAEGQASKGEFEQAIKTQEAASANLVKALRRLGIMIPGF